MCVLAALATVRPASPPSPVRVELIGYDGTTLSTNDIVLVAVTFSDGADFEALPCAPTLTLNVQPRGENASFVSADSITDLMGYDLQVMPNQLVFMYSIKPGTRSCFFTDARVCMQALNLSCLYWQETQLHRLILEANSGETKPIRWR